MLALQSQLNNNLNVVIEIILNEIIYDFKIKKALLLLHNRNLTRNDIVNKHLKYRIKTIEVIAFANAKAKIYYDARHILLILKLDNRIYLRFNHDYYLLSKFSKKTSS